MAQLQAPGAAPAPNSQSPTANAAAQPAVQQPAIPAVALPGMHFNEAVAELARQGEFTDQNGERRYVRIQLQDINTDQVFTVIRQLKSVDDRRITWEGSQLSNFPNGLPALGPNEQTLATPNQWGRSIGDGGLKRDGRYIDMGLRDAQGDARLFEVLAVSPFIHHIPGGPQPGATVDPRQAPENKVPDIVSYSSSAPRREGAKFSINWQATGTTGEQGQIIIPREFNGNAVVGVIVANQSFKKIDPRQPKTSINGQTVDNWVDVVKVDITVRTPANGYGISGNGKILTKEALIVVDRYGFPLREVNNLFAVERRKPPAIQTPLQVTPNPALQPPQIKQPLQPTANPALFDQNQQPITPTPSVAPPTPNPPVPNPPAIGPLPQDPANPPGAQANSRPGIVQYQRNLAELASIVGEIRTIFRESSPNSGPLQANVLLLSSSSSAPNHNRQLTTAADNHGRTIDLADSRMSAIVSNATTATAGRTEPHAILGRDAELVGAALPTSHNGNPAIVWLDATAIDSNSFVQTAFKRAWLGARGQETDRQFSIVPLTAENGFTLALSENRSGTDATALQIGLRPLAVDRFNA